MPKDDVAVVGGPYVEDPDFVPNPTDLHGTFNTSGVGAHHDPSTVSPIFEVDRQATAAQIAAALDDDDDSVSSDTVLFPSHQQFAAADPEADKEALLNRAQARLDNGPVVIGEPGPAEKEAAESGDEGAAAADRQEAKNSSSTSASTGSHDTAGDGGEPGSSTSQGGSPKSASASDDDSDEKFRPGDHTVTEVNEHLAGADEAEQKRVLRAERRGQNRSTVNGI